MKPWLLLGCALFSSQLVAFPRANPVTGGIIELSLAPITDKQPSATYAGEHVTIVPKGNDWVALIGIPLDAESGTHYINVNDGRRMPFNVSEKAYRTQRLSIKDTNKVNPDEESSARIVQEMQLQQQYKTQFTTTAPDLNFIRPVAGRDTGRFGMRRILNNQPRNPHSGMDIAAATGTPVKATSAGKVLYTGNFFFSGNTVYVDHGSGVISLYAHLSSINVTPGESLQQGDIVGAVGSTGRATGPHLHWSIYLNGTAVDPALFI